MAPQLYNKTAHAIRFWLLRTLPTCKEMVHVMSESMERRLSLRERIVLKAHLWICVWCAWYLEHLHVMRDALRARAAQSNWRREKSTDWTRKLSARRAWKGANSSSFITMTKRKQ